MRSKILPEVPLSCRTANSGASRKRRDRSKFKVMKLPNLELPYPSEASWLMVPKVPYVVLKAPVGFFWFNPDFVIAFTTKLVLSPYSAGVAPVITSSDCTAVGGNCVENVLVC